MNLKRFGSKLGWVLLFTVIALQIQVTVAYAYLDPGTGSYLFQIIAAALLGMLFAFKIFWRKVVAIFKRKKVITDHAQEQDQGPNAK